MVGEDVKPNKEENEKKENNLLHNFSQTLSQFIQRIKSYSINVSWQS